MRNVLRHLWLLPRKTIATLISVYQNTLSLDHGPLRHIYPYGFCRHEPTCSAYGKAVILEKGVIIGGLLTIRRVVSCNPWTKISEKKILHIADRLRYNPRSTRV